MGDTEPPKFRVQINIRNELIQSPSPPPPSPQNTLYGWEDGAHVVETAGSRQDKE